MMQIEKTRVLRQRSRGRKCRQLPGRGTEGMTITQLIAKESEAQGDVVVALGVHALGVPADTFVHPAIVPSQEAARQGNMI